MFYICKEDFVMIFGRGGDYKISLNPSFTKRETGKGGFRFYRYLIIPCFLYNVI